MFLFVSRGVSGKHNINTNGNVVKYRFSFINFRTSESSIQRTEAIEISWKYIFDCIQKEKNEEKKVMILIKNAIMENITFFKIYTHIAGRTKCAQ